MCERDERCSRIRHGRAPGLGQQPYTFTCAHWRQQGWQGQFRRVLVEFGDRHAAKWTRVFDGLEELARALRVLYDEAIHLPDDPYHFFWQADCDLTRAQQGG